MKKAKLFIGLLLLLVGCSLVSVGGHGRSPHEPTNNTEFAQTAVMITAPDGRSGGTGVILDSHPGLSHILTNKHVCQLIPVGGVVITDDGKSHKVDTYRVYPKHDLCMVGVYADLGINIKVADSSPSDYSLSVVSGHPHLLPTMVTYGHFAQKRTISMVVGFDPCKGDETDDDIFSCMFLGGKPIVQSFTARPTSSLIMAGSSGSAVYNEKGELAGLIFAGEQGMSYGFMVPWEYINDFLRNKRRYKEEVPNPAAEKRNFFTSYAKLEQVCGEKSVNDIPKLCKSTKSLGLWFQ